MNIVEIAAKTALVKSRIPGVAYAVNPYLGCAHGCRYCYAVFMRKYSKHNLFKPWGQFVEVKTNIADVLRAELARKRSTDRAMLSSVCDPYQPAERRYELTRRCILALKDFGWGIDILTKSPLVIRDLDIIASAIDLSLGFSIGTDDDNVRAILEPCAPPIASRIEALKKLHAAGIRTWVFIAPMLPMNAERLCELIAPHVDEVMADGLNYQSQVTSIYSQRNWSHALTNNYSEKVAEIIGSYFGAKFTRV